ncbi:MAG: PPOX class F420-dependent oxidoreductase [Actinobacteria bacterium]|nr:PPOX class F420-dependent oxidoreductase [Actinomycetota bacterium]
MDDRVRSFLQHHHSAIMTTLREDGTPHVARIGVGLVDGRLWSSGTETRVRTGHLRRDPRSTLCVLDNDDAYSWLGLETTVTVLDGPEAVDQNLALYRVLAGEPKDLDEYRRAMEEEQRLVYEFAVTRAYGRRY